MVMAYYNTFEVNAKILRPFNTFGPRQSERAVIPTIIRQILDNSCKVIKLGSLSPVRDFNYVSNTVDAFLELATSNDATQGEVYNTGSGIGVTIGQVVNMLMDICGIAKPVEIDNHRKRPAKSEVLELIADSQKLIKASAWTSSVCLKTGLEKTVDWWTASPKGLNSESGATYKI